MGWVGRVTGGVGWVWSQCLTGGSGSAEVYGILGRFLRAVGGGVDLVADALQKQVRGLQVGVGMGVGEAGRGGGSDL